MYICILPSYKWLQVDSSYNMRILTNRQYNFIRDNPWSLQYIEMRCHSLPSHSCNITHVSLEVHQFQYMYQFKEFLHFSIFLHFLYFIYERNGTMWHFDASILHMWLPMLFHSCYFPLIKHDFLSLDCSQTAYLAKFKSPHTSQISSCCFCLHINDSGQAELWHRQKHLNNDILLIFKMFTSLEATCMLYALLVSQLNPSTHVHEF